MIVLLTLGLAFGAVGGEAPNGAQGVVEGMVDDALEILRTNEDHGERLRKLRALASQHFDWRSMAQSSLGPTWRELQAEQRNRFVSLYEDIMAAEYSDTINQFHGDERVTVDGSKQRGEAVEVETTVVTHSRQRTPVTYRLQRMDGKWQVTDFQVEGVSMVNHLRKSYQRYLVNNSFSDLAKRMKRKSQEVAP